MALRSGGVIYMSAAGRVPASPQLRMSLTCHFKRCPELHFISLRGRHANQRMDSIDTQYPLFLNGLSSNRPKRFMRIALCLRILN